MKATAIALAALTVFDAIAYQGEYRSACIAAAVRWMHWIADQQWDTFLL